MLDGVAGRGCRVLASGGDKKPLSEIEHCIITKYRRPLWRRFMKAVIEFGLVEEGDKIAVAVSGGKDSMLMAKLFQELRAHGDVPFDLEFIVADPGYHEDIKKLLVENCGYLNIPIKIFDSDIFAILDRIAKDKPCFMCAKMRRGALYSRAKKLGCNKLALGHHFNDVIETTLLNMFYTGCFKTMLPKLKSEHFAGLELIRPLYYIEEKDIEEYTRYTGIQPLNCACMVAAERTSNKRYDVKDLIGQLKKSCPDVDKRIFKSAMNVNMDSIVGWEKGGKRYSYLDFYRQG